MSEIKLGMLIRDRVTTFTGIAAGRTEWLSGCVRWCLQPQGLDKDGKTIPYESFDEQTLEIVGDGIMRVSRPAGGPNPEPTRARDPLR